MFRKRSLFGGADGYDIDGYDIDGYDEDTRPSAAS
jgi:hypothetical protein